MGRANDLARAVKLLGLSDEASDVMPDVGCAGYGEGNMEKVR